MDENNHYGQAMTKPLPYGCIKKQEHPPSLLEFHMAIRLCTFLLLISSFTIKIQKLCCSMKFTCLSFKKNKKMEPFERPSIQLMSILVRNEEKDKINTFSYISKTHSTQGEKNFISFYAEHIHFLIKRAGWLVTYIYEHYTFEQSKF